MPSGIDIVYRSEDQRALLERLGKVAKADVEVLITGPSGVGKELYAAYTHENSRRRQAPMITVNCSNLPGHMLENELFGHARGAYTGAHVAMAGIAGAAEGGSLFLDEIDTLPPISQAKLLRFIQTKEYRRLGETKLRRADVRVIAASNANLEDLVRTGRFREDLYFRLRVVPICIKPLADRRDDIEPLCDHFAVRYALEYALPQIDLSASAQRCLNAYCWPGNVRELENCVRYLTCLDLGRPVEPDDLLLYAFDTDREVFAPPAESAETDDEAEADYHSADPATETMQVAKSRLVDSFERFYVDRALNSTGGNISEAARLSGKHRRAFFELLRKHEIDVEQYRQR
jgi:two-component system, NtrC family, response regulator GlrR